MTPHIFLDTTALEQDRGLTFQNTVALVAAARSRGVNLVISEVVRDELLGGFGRDLPAKYSDAIKSVDAFERYTSSTLTISPALQAVGDAAQERYRLRLEAMLQSPVRLWPVTLDDAQGAIKRAITRRRPSTSKGEQLRDAIIWEGILRYARHQEPSTAIYFVTNDNQYYSDNGMAAPDILDDIGRSERSILVLRQPAQLVELLSIPLPPIEPIGDTVIEITAGRIFISPRAGIDVSISTPQLEIIGRGFDWYPVAPIDRRPLKTGAIVDLDTRAQGEGFIRGQWRIGELQRTGFVGGRLSISGTAQTPLSIESQTMVTATFEATGILLGHEGHHGAAYEGRPLFRVPFFGRGVAHVKYASYDDPQFGLLYDPISAEYLFG